ncbi:hypothetical protein HY469_05080 [Candidatus Roizmanbacteria bacterium]|nr:hypothetical protein [Candidatus Roizmanbacteria bacterium]
MSSVIEGARLGMEKPVQWWLEKHSFVPVESDSELAATARIDTLRATWALKGLDDLLEFDEMAFLTESGMSDPRVDQLAEGILYNHWQEPPSIRLQATLKRLMSVPHRKELLTRALSAIYEYGAVPEEAEESGRRISMMLDITEGKIRPPQGDRHAVILTQTAYLLGNEIDGQKKETQLSYGFNEWAKFAIELGSGALPYMGAAVLYSELLGTGRFRDIKIIDFRDKEAIETMIEQGGCDLALVSGATTYDRHLIDNVNKRLVSAGLTVINGGVAPTIDLEPQRYLKNGVSIFLGEFEGAGEQLMEELDNNTSPRVFVRDGNRHKQRQLEATCVPFSALADLPERVDVNEVYSPNRQKNGYLAHRLEAMHMMRPYATFGGKTYEANPFFSIHETSCSYGCPEVCSFCATVPFQGTKMRHRSLESLEQEWEAIDTGNIAIVDQNFHANGRDYVTEVLRLAKRLDKRLAFEGELMFFLTSPPEAKNKQKYFFDGTEADIERGQLLKDVVLGIEIGLEQPVKVLGTIPGGKDPNQFAEAQKRLNKLGVPTFGTVIIGMPELLSAPGARTDISIIPRENMSPAEWEEMLQTWVHWLEEVVPSPGAIPFAFTVIPGTLAFEILKNAGMLKPGYEDPGTITERKELKTDISPSLNPDVIKGISARKAVSDLRKKLYAWPSIRKRVGAANFSLKRKVYMYGFNLFAGVTLRDEMG